MTAPWAPSGQLRAGGKALEYACWGPGPDAAPTIVLLHEGLGCVALWRDFPERLAAATGWGVFAYSRAGYGGSDAADLPRPLDYMEREAEDVLPQVLDAMGLRRTVLVGHSDGASIAAIYAGRMVDARVAGVALMAPHFFTEDMGLHAIAAANQAYAKGDLRGRLAKYHTDPDHSFRGWCDSWLNPDFKAWTIEDVIGGITVPVLAIQGRQDQYGTLAQIDALVHGCNGGVETLILDDCRHSPQFDQDDAVLAGLARFVGALA